LVKERQTKGGKRIRGEKLVCKSGQKGKRGKDKIEPSLLITKSNVESSTIKEKDSGKRYWIKIHVTIITE